MAEHPHEHHLFEKPGRLFTALERAGARQVVFAGAMVRPQLKLWRLDFTGVRIALRVLALLRQGDDAMLRGLGEFFEKRGIALVGPEVALGGEMFLSAGSLGKVSPSHRDLADARQAARIVEVLGPLDIGQGAVVAGGLCLGIETVEGTDLMLQRIGELSPERRQVPVGRGVLYKGPKPGQDRRLDRPAIGPDTVRAAIAASLAGITAAAEETVLIDAAGTRRLADAAGLFVHGLTAEERLAGCDD